MPPIKTTLAIIIIYSKTMKKLKGTIQIGTKRYSCEIKNGTYYVNGLIVDEFVKTLPPYELAKVTMVGLMALQDEMNGVKPPKGKYQYYMIS
jgi:hypothetical protein